MNEPPLHFNCRCRIVPPASPQWGPSVVIMVCFVAQAVIDGLFWWAHDD